MDALVVGATGAIGPHVVAALLDAGHSVTGSTTRAERLGAIKDLGARAVVLDSLDPESARSAVAEVGPEAIVDVSTRLPAAGPRRSSDMRATNRLRREGTGNLLAAARAAGSRRFVKESMMFVYGFGTYPEPVTESQPIGVEQRRGFREVCGAMADAERQVAAATRAGEVEGVTMRFGLFHGASAPSSRAMADLVARRRVPLLGGGGALHSWIAIEDAAAAVALAVGATDPAPAYNVADDEPVRFRDYLGELARVLDAPPPRSLPGWLARPVMGYATRFMSGVEVSLSNELLRTDLGWQPEWPSYRDVLASLGASERG